MEKKWTPKNGPMPREIIFEGLYEEALLASNPGSTRVSAWKELNAMVTAREKEAAEKADQYQRPNIWIAIETKDPRQDAQDDDGEFSSFPE